MNSPQATTGDGPRERVPLIAFSLLAATAAVVHVAVPGLQIDSTTLVLFALAALPWPAPVRKARAPVLYAER